MKRAAIAIAILSLAACSNDKHAEPVTGVVSRLSYDDPDDWTTTEYCDPKNDYTMTCFGGFKTIQHHDGPHWYVAVASDDDKVHVIEVDQATYDACVLGRTWMPDGRCMA